MKSDRPTPAQFRSKMTLSVAVAVAFVAWQGYVVLVAEHGMPENPPGQDAYWVVETAGETTLTQTIEPEILLVNRFVIHARPAGPKPQGDVVFDVLEGWDAHRLVLRRTVPIEQVVAAPGYEVQFPVIQRPLIYFWSYHLRVSVPQAGPGQGVRLLANRSDTCPAGRLFVGGREQWGDLVFRTGSNRATVFRNLSVYLRAGPGPAARPAWLLGAAFAVYGAALLTFLWRMVFADDLVG